MAKTPVESAITKAFKNNGEPVDGRMFTAEEVSDAVGAVIEEMGDDDVIEREARDDLPDTTIDAMGRIYVDGFLVGWVKRDSGLVELLGLNTLGAICQAPIR